MIIPVKTKIGSYNIYLERGSLSKLNEYLNLNRKALILTDDGVPEKYLKQVIALCKNPFPVIIKQGEGSKSMRSFQKVLRAMIEASFDRSDCVIALGGGVIGDLAGFVAASYMRGIDFYNIPTTLLSQVDSSIGGKVAVDFCGYKNIVGAFYPPNAVVIDSNVLATLDNRQISNGLAESVKMSLTSDKELFEMFESREPLEIIDEIIYRSLLIKKSVVEQDETEKGLRKILNFGHTIGHAIESSISLKDYYHGECVAAGMLLTVSEEVKSRLIVVLKKLNLPTYIPCSKVKMINALKHDKKSFDTGVTEIFVEKVGKFIMKDISFDDLSKLIKKEYKQ